MAKINYKKRSKVWNLLNDNLLFSKLEVYFLATNFLRIRLEKNKSLIIKKNGTWYLDD